MITIVKWALANMDAWDPPKRMPSPFNDVTDAIWISYHINKFFTETETKTREKKSMKPKVRWRCLKTDAPREGRYWFSGKHGAVELLWIDEKADERAYARAPLADLLRLDWTHWAPCEAPEPPPKPTPFEAWWNQRTAAVVNDRGFVTVAMVAGKDDYSMSVGRSTAEACFLAGYEACAKNMAAGGAK